MDDPTDVPTQAQTTEQTQPANLVPDSAGEDGRPSYDENTPLLTDHQTSTGNGEHGAQPAQNGTPTRPDERGTFDKTQVILLSICRVADPIVFFSILPFINQMIYDTGEVPEERVGYYSGLIESIFSVVQMIMLIPWGKAADKYGRKPILICSLTGLLITGSAFGFCKTIWQMLLLRSAAGLFSGSVVAMRAMISENSTPKTQALAYSIFGFFSNIGIFAGTLIGGFANPAEQYGGIFKRVRFFDMFPYAFPTLIMGIFILATLVICIFFVRETLDPDRIKSGNESPMSTWEVAKSPGVPMVLLIYSIVALLGFSFTAVMPVFWFTSVKLGGFGFKPQMISYFVALGGASQAAWTLLALPYLQNRFGTGGVLRGCAIAWPIFFALNPLANLVLKMGAKKLFWSAAPVVVALGSSCAMAFTATQLILNDVSPSPATLGTINGIGLSLSSGMRAFSPGLFTSIYAKGVDDQILGGQLVWPVLIAMALSLGLSLFWLPEKAEGRLPRQNTENIEDGHPGGEIERTGE